jgi:hypothetical protein
MRAGCTPMFTNVSIRSNNRQAGGIVSRHLHGSRLVETLAEKSNAVLDVPEPFLLIADLTLDTE